MCKIKNVIAVLILLITVVVIGCVKEDNHMSVGLSSVTHTEVSPDCFPSFGDRDGEKLSWDFPGSQVIVNYFVVGKPVWAINAAKLDSATYVRYSTSGANIQGVIFNKYVTTKYFSDNTTIVRKVYAPAYGASYVIYPVNVINQLDVSNPYNYICLFNTAKQEPYFDHYCGKNKRRYQFIIIGTDIDTLGTEGISGDRCNSSVFSYKLLL